MSVYNRQGLMHSRKVITSSFRSSFMETKRKFNETIYPDQASSLLVIHERIPKRDFAPTKYGQSRKSEDVWEVKKTPAVFVSTSKPSIAIDRLLTKRKTDHENAVERMSVELAASYAACEEEFRNRSISVKIHINGLRRGIEEARDKLRATNLLDLTSEHYDAAWKEVSALIMEEKRMVNNFYERLLIIEKKRYERVKSILQRYYKIYHNISYLLPYDIQVYLENEILNYNGAVLENHRIYADLRLQMSLLADTAKMKFKHWMAELKMDIPINGD